MWLTADQGILKLLVERPMIGREPESEKLTKGTKIPMSSAILS